MNTEKKVFPTLTDAFGDVYNFDDLLPELNHFPCSSHKPTFKPLVKYKEYTTIPLWFHHTFISTDRFKSDRSAQHIQFQKI